MLLGVSRSRRNSSTEVANHTAPARTLVGNIDQIVKLLPGQPGTADRPKKLNARLIVLRKDVDGLLDDPERHARYSLPFGSAALLLDHAVRPKPSGESVNELGDQRRVLQTTVEGFLPRTSTPISWIAL
jgi:hypothetical protein